MKRIAVCLVVGLSGGPALAASPGALIVRTCMENPDDGPCKMLVAGFIAGMQAARFSSDKGAACDDKTMSDDKLVNWIVLHREEWDKDLPTLLYEAECTGK